MFPRRFGQFTAEDEQGETEKPSIIKGSALMMLGQLAGC